MSAIANIVVADAATTPVNHTFVPQKVSGDLAIWNEKSASTPQGYWELTSKMTDPTGNGTVYRIKVGFSYPVLKSYTDLSGNAVTAVDYTLRVNAEFIIPLRSILQNRKDVRKMFVGILNDAQFTDMIEQLNHAY